MIARFDHRPMLTATLALSTTVLFVVVVTLSTLLITLSPSASPASDSGGGKPAAAAPANMDAGGENYGWDIHAKRGSSMPQNGDVERHAEVVERLGNGSLR
jgi:hypothetical protein